MSSYNTGTISIAANADIAIGTGTHWKDNKFGVAPAQTILIKVGNTFKLSAIKNVNSDTELVLIDKFSDAVSNATYFIQTSVPDTYSDAARKVTAQLGYTDELLFNLNKWMTENGVVTVVTPEGKTIQLKSINALASDISNRLTKDQNGADIPNKSEFIKNLGLTETVELAKSAVPNSRKVNGKALSGDISLNAGDVGAVNGLTDFDDLPDNNYIGIFESGLKTQWAKGINIGNKKGDVGQVYVGNNGDLYSYFILARSKARQGGVVNTHPVGSPIPYPHRYTPPGYLTCNGQTFDKSLYPKLAEAYPAGRVPDLRGEFIRGWDDSRGVDPGRVCGTWQADATKRIQLASGYGNENSYLWTYQGAPGGYKYPLGRDAMGTATATSIADNTGGHETRPRNIAFNYIVRAA
ncbi:phage tail protein [Photorhabdus laumondii]|uniref:phage tail protein n=2 Tax=Photorhabdus laumondii TaxID=2218628 RepID=UPI0022A96116|nr:phage tail protein [Photorhabdus laumondii]